MITIFRYTEPSPYLRDVWMEKKRTNPRFTIRAWANQLDFKYHNAFYEIIMGKRKLPKAYVPGLIGNLALKAEEGLYLDTLVDLERAKTAKEKQVYVERLRALSPQAKLTVHEIETFRSLQDPLHIIITELSCLKGFKKSPLWIKNKLGFKRSLLEIEEAMERLVGLGLMTSTPDGKFQKVHKHNYSKSDLLDEGLQEYHKNVMGLAQKAISRQGVDEREYQAYCINMNLAKVPEAKQLIRKFMNDFGALMEAPEGEAENTYQLNLQFFNLTEDIE